MEEKRRFKANIDGKEYTIVGHKTAQHLNTVVDILNNQLDQLKELDPNLSAADRSILIAVNTISDQLIKEQRILDLETELASFHSRKTYDGQTNLFDSYQENSSSQIPFESD